MSPFTSSSSTASGASTIWGWMSMMENTFSDDASADCSQLNCSARFWMGVKNLEIYI